MKNVHKIDISNINNRSFSDTNKNEKDNEITEAYIKWLVSDLQPFTTSSCKTFQKFVSKLNPDYKIPSRQRTKRLIKKHYESEKVKISQTLEKLPGKISLTTDLWTSIDMEGFCGITAHFIDETWRLQHILLDIAPISSPHTGEAIKDILLDTISSFNLTKKILAITTDNGANMVKAVDLLKLEMQDEFGQKMFHIRCAAHIINLAVQEGLQSFSK